jgi:hypothetical protein
MDTANEGGGGGSGSNGNSSSGWRAEAAIAGNRRALQALRELVTYPYLYARESRLLGLKVLCCLLLPSSLSATALPVNQ